jgi:hypothetical protein
LADLFEMTEKEEESNTLTVDDGFEDVKLTPVPEARRELNTTSFTVEDLSEPSDETEPKSSNIPTIQVDDFSNGITNIPKIQVEDFSDNMETKTPDPIQNGQDTTADFADFDKNDFGSWETSKQESTGTDSSDFGNFQSSDTTNQTEWGNFADFKSNETQDLAFEANFDEPQGQQNVQLPQPNPTAFADLPEEERENKVVETLTSAFGSFSPESKKTTIIDETLEDMIENRSCFLSLGVLKDLQRPRVPYTQQKYFSSLGITILPDELHDPDVAPQKTRTFGGPPATLLNMGPTQSSGTSESWLPITPYNITPVNGTPNTSHHGTPTHSQRSSLNFA